MINSFEVSNFKNISGNITLGNVNVLIGPNNSGKTNFLRALSFWSDIVTLKPEKGTTALIDAVAKNGGSRMLRFGSESKKIAFQWELEINDRAPFKYQLELLMSDVYSDTLISLESLSYANPLSGKKNPFEFFNCHNLFPGYGAFAVNEFDGNKRREKISISQNETVFQQMAEICKSSPEFIDPYIRLFQPPMLDIVDYLSLFRSYSSGRFDLPKMINSSKGSTQRLSSDGSDLASVLLWLMRNDIDAFQQYREMVTPLFYVGRTIDVFIDPRDGGNPELTIVVGSKKYFLSDLSDGTLKMMLLAALMVDQKYPLSSLVIDEPEINLHPAWQDRFVFWMLNSNSSRQYFISTHSPEILDSLTDSFEEGKTKVFVFSIDGSIRPLSIEDVRSWLNKRVNLGDLYRSKALEIGGWA